MYMDESISLDELKGGFCVPLCRVSTVRDAREGQTVRRNLEEMVAHRTHRRLSQRCESQGLPDALTESPAGEPRLRLRVTLWELVIPRLPLQRGLSRPR